MDAVVNISKINLKNLVNLSSLVYRLKHGGGYKRQAITKAVGANNNKKLNIIDATCGLGTDAIILAYFNCQVYAIERNPKVYQLLIKRMMQAREDLSLQDSISNIKLFLGNCIEVIPKIIVQYEFIPDVIYLDPMFNQPKKSAPNKFIQILQNILSNKDSNNNGTDSKDGKDNNDNLLKSILNFPYKKRIVVKRSRLAPYLDNLPPTFSLIGKANRFDIYVKH